jgi:hypothetical protein
MVAPEVMGHIDPVCLAELKDEREARKSKSSGMRQGTVKSVNWCQNTPVAQFTSLAADRSPATP